MIELSYAEGGDYKKGIVEINLKDKEELSEFMDGIVAKDDKNTVYLFTSDYSSLKFGEEIGDYSMELYVESDPSVISMLIKNNLDYSNCALHLFEYFSFEDAYKTALDMREGNYLCYDKTKFNEE